VPRVRWAQQGETSIAFETGGSGPDVVEVQAGAALTWSTHPLTRAWPERVREFARFTCFDAQGCGRSDPLPAGHVPSIEQKVEEVLAVMDAAKVDRGVMVGFFAGAPVALALAALHPDRVRAVIAVNGYARLTADVDFSDGVPADSRESFERDIRSRFGTGWMVRRWIPELAELPEVQAFMEDYEQELSSRGQIVLGAKLASSLDVRDLLPAVTVPVTVVHADRNQVVPVALARDLHHRLAHSTLVEVSTSHHLFTVPPMLDATVDAVRAMVGDEAPRRDRTVIAALLFTDIVGSTQRLAALHDGTWAALLTTYNDRCESTVRRLGGTLVKTTGDGVLAVFRSAAAGIRAAAALTDVADRLGLVARAAVHVGDVEEVDGDVLGMAVHVTARLLDVASQGGIVVSGAAAHAAIGSGLRLVAAGETELRGVQGRWPVFRLDR
jgi:class 3 adenylate cyclase